MPQTIEVAARAPAVLCVLGLELQAQGCWLSPAGRARRRHEQQGLRFKVLMHVVSCSPCRVAPAASGGKMRQLLVCLLLVLACTAPGTRAKRSPMKRKGLRNQASPPTPPPPAHPPPSPQALRESRLQWQAVLQNSPADFEANKQLGVSLANLNDYNKALPHLQAALKAHSVDYESLYYAAIVTKLLADNPSQSLSAKATLRREAAGLCSEGWRQADSLRKRGRENPVPRLSRRMWWIHCCEALKLVGEDAEAGRCVTEAVTVEQLWKVVGQRPATYHPGIKAQPWWTPEELGPVMAGHIMRLKTAWQQIRDEAMALLMERPPSTSRVAPAAHSAGIFKPEVDGLHDNKTWHQAMLWLYGARQTSACEAAPVTCQLLASMPESSGRTVGNIEFSLMMPGTYVRPHTGPNNFRLRLHLGLEVPTPLQNQRLRVGDGPPRSWAEGEVQRQRNPGTRCPAEKLPSIFNGTHFRPIVCMLEGHVCIECESCVRGLSLPSSGVLTGPDIRRLP